MKLIKVKPTKTLNLVHKSCHPSPLTRDFQIRDYIVFNFKDSLFNLNQRGGHTVWALPQVSKLGLVVQPLISFKVIR